MFLRHAILVPVLVELTLVSIFGGAINYIYDNNPYHQANATQMSRNVVFVAMSVSEQRVAHSIKQEIIATTSQALATATPVTKINTTATPRKTDATTANTPSSNISDFLQNFLANLLATIIGIGVGAPVGLWLDRQVKEREIRAEQLKEAKIRKEWSLKILKSIKAELRENVNFLRQAVDALIDSVVFGNVSLSSWDIVSPRVWEYLDNYELLQQIAHVFTEYQWIQRDLNTQFSMHHSVLLALENYQDLRETLVKSTISQAQDVIQETDKVLIALEAELHKLEETHE
jgi:hypothetical protein